MIEGLSTEITHRKLNHMQKILLSAIYLIMSGSLLVGAPEKPEDAQEPRNETTELEDKLSLIKKQRLILFG